MSNVRALAAETLYNVVDKGASLNQELPFASQGLSPKDKALLQQICYGVLRYLPSLENYCQQLLDQPLKGKRRIFQFLLYVGIYQLQHMRVPPHAAISETVNALQQMRALGLKGLINAILRSFQREQAELEEKAKQIPVCKFNHPGWFIKQVTAAYPDNWQEILKPTNCKHLCGYVNQAQYSTQEYSEMLKANDIEHTLNADFPDGIKLAKPCDVYALPEFDTGACSVQDAAAQLAARFLDPQNDDVILDACAAPGGKTCHILELADADVLALDSDSERLERVKQNLVRIGLAADLQCADASQPHIWWDEQQFDRILLDVPCSATGVIRRHPDIKWLRRASDIEDLAALQGDILNSIWPLLKPGGTLVYATCSVLPQENSNKFKFQPIMMLNTYQLHENDTQLYLACNYCLVKVTVSITQS